MEGVEMAQSGPVKETPLTKEQQAEIAEGLKNQGNEAFKIGDYQKAVTFYS